MNDVVGLMDNKFMNIDMELTAKCVESLSRSC